MPARTPNPRPSRTPTPLDERIQTLTGTLIDTLWQQHQQRLLDEPVAQLVTAHQALAKAHTAVAFHRDQISRLSGGTFTIDSPLLLRLGRVLEQLEDAVALRDTQHTETLALLKVAERTRPRTGPGDLPDLAPPDFAALLAIASGAMLHQNLMTGRRSVATASGSRIPYAAYQRLESAGLVHADASRPPEAGQPVALTETGRRALTRARPAPAPAPARAGAWPTGLARR